MNYTNKEPSLLSSKARSSGNIYATVAVAIVSVLGSGTQAQSTVISNPAPKNNVITTVTVGSEPFGLVVSPDNKFVYVANNGDNTVSVINTKTNKVHTTISSVPSPTHIAVSSDGTKLYVSNDVASGTVTLVDLSNGNSTQTITGFGSNPYGLALTPDGTQLWVANSGGNTIDVVNTRTNAIISSIVVASGPRAVGFTPNGQKAYVSAGHKVYVIDTASKAVTTTIAVGNNPLGLAVTPTGNAVYVIDLHASKDSSNCKVIDTATDTITKVIHMGSGFPGSQPAMLPNGKYLYYPESETGDVTLISTATNSVVGGLCVRPAGLDRDCSGRHACLCVRRYRRLGYGSGDNAIGLSANPRSASLLRG